MDQVALDRLAARASNAGFPSPAHYAIHLEAEVQRLRRKRDEYERHVEYGKEAIARWASNVERLRSALEEIAELPEPWKWGEGQRTWREIASEALSSLKDQPDGSGS